MHLVFRQEEWMVIENISFTGNFGPNWPTRGYNPGWCRSHPTVSEMS